MEYVLLKKIYDLYAYNMIDIIEIDKAKDQKDIIKIIKKYKSLEYLYKFILFHIKTIYLYKYSYFLFLKKINLK